MLSKLILLRIIILCIVIFRTIFNEIMFKSRHKVQWFKHYYLLILLKIIIIYRFICHAPIYKGLTCIFVFIYYVNKYIILISFSLSNITPFKLILKSKGSLPKSSQLILNLWVYCATFSKTTAPVKLSISQLSLN